MKLLFFPTPYPDELLYSVLARYHFQSRNLSYKDTLWDLFGSSTACAVSDLPNRLSTLCSRLRSNDIITPDFLIEKNTLFPFYKPFLSQVQARVVRERMLTAKAGGDVHMSVGVMASTISSPRYLRICPECYKEDDERYGEPYWHRSHQVAGVRICHKHSVALIETTVAVSSKQNKHAFHMLVESLIKNKPLTSCNKSYALMMAKSAHWLLNNDVPVMGLDKLHEKYLHGLRARGLATAKRRTRQRELISAFRSFYGVEFLAEQTPLLRYQLRIDTRYTPLLF